MTLQDLKDNRNEIINFINGRGYNLKFAMEMAVELCVLEIGVPEFDSINDALSDGFEAKSSAQCHESKVIG